jgi:hypothetical protein
MMRRANRTNQGRLRRAVRMRRKGETGGSKPDNHHRTSL